VVSGSSGLIGRALLRKLSDEGHEIITLVRRPPRGNEVQWDPPRATIDSAGLEGCDAVVNLAGAGIGDRRWSPARKREILESRVGSTALLCQTLAGLTRRPRVLVNASAIGVYGSRGDEVLTEDSAAGTGFLAEVCGAWESATSSAESAGIRVVHLRTSVVLAAEGGALARQLSIFKLGLGGRLGRGDQWLSWISLSDELRAILHVLTQESHSGPVNAVAPSPVTNASFTRALGSALHRPAVLVVPGAALRMALGREMADEMVLASQRVLPERLQASGFSFDHPSVDQAIAAALAA
jgi:uncharacterized protein (TIGR01777 family)